MQTLENTDSFRQRRDKTNANFTALNDAIAANFATLSALLNDTIDDAFSAPISALLRDKGGQRFDVKAYGAVGDGVADDTAALIAADAAARTAEELGTAAGSAIRYLPRGRYRISGSASPLLNFDFTSAIWEGDGPTQSIITTDDTTHDVIWITASNVMLRHLQIVRAGTPTAGDTVRLVENVGGTNLIDVNINKCFNGFRFYGVGGASASGTRLKSVNIGPARGSGFFSDAAAGPVNTIADDLYVVCDSTAPASYGVNILTGVDWQWDRLKVEFASADAVWIHPGVGQVTGQFFWSNVTLDSSAAYNFHVSGEGSVNLGAFKGMWLGTAGLDGGLIDGSSVTQILDLQFPDLISTNNQHSGMRIKGTSTTKGVEINGCSITFNNRSNGSHSGIDLEGTVDGVMINGKIGTTLSTSGDPELQQYGIAAASTVTNIELGLTDIRGNVIAPLSRVIGDTVRAYHSTNQSIADVTFTDLALDSELFDGNALHDNTTNNHRLTCRRAGTYLITGNVNFAASAVGVRLARLNLSGVAVLAEDTRNAASAGGTTIQLSTVYRLAVGDFVTLNVFQNSGAPLNAVAVPNYSPDLSMTRIGN